MSDYEKLVQEELAGVLPVMSPDKWEEVRAAIAALISKQVNEANNRAQAIMLDSQHRAMQMGEVYGAGLEGR